MSKIYQTNKYSNGRANFKRKYPSNKRNVIVLTVFFLLVALGIGYAYLTSNLTIQGAAEIAKNTWDVHFENVVPDPNNVSATKEATISSDKMQVDFDVALSLPGDEYNFTVDVVNNGTIPAMLNLVELVGITEEQQKYLEYQVLYLDGDTLLEKDALPVGGKETYQVYIKYKDDITKNDLPTENQTVSLSLQGNYIQDDGTSIKRLKEIILRQVSYSDTTFLKGPLAKDTIETVEFVTYQEVPSDATASWDVSEKQDGTIMAYYYDQDGNGLYEVYIGSRKQKIKANTNSSHLFYELTKVTSINLEKLDTSKVTNMYRMFYYCSKLTSLDISSFDTSQVTDMSEMFYNCSSLTSLDISSFDTSKVTNMYRMFYGCRSLTSLNLSSFNTSQVTDMSEMFYNCSSLTSLDLSNFDTFKVTRMSSMFYNCSSLTSLDLSSFDTSQVTNMEAMFDRCSSLTSLNLSSFNTSQVMNMKSMFNGCSSLTSLDVSNFNTSQVTDMSYMFQTCSGLTNLDLSNFDTSQVTGMSSMFAGCSNLTRLNVSSFDTSQVTDMQFMFYSCSGLTALDLSNFDTSQVTGMRSMFYSCRKLTATITIRNVNTSDYTDMFYDTATSSGTQITVNYTADTSTLVDNMITTKSINSNVVKGNLVS